MELKDILKNVRIQKININKNNISDLDKNEYQNIQIFINALQSNDNCKIVLRGEQLDTAYLKAGVSVYNTTEKQKFRQLGKSVFYLGSKSDSYLCERKKNGFPIKLGSIEDIEFRLIYEEFESITDSSSFIGETLFIDYFKNQNKDDFVSIFNKIDDIEKWKFKLYYLWILHVLEIHGYKNYSNFKSTSEDYGIASLCSDLIYFGWISKPYDERSVYYDSLFQMKDKMERLGLPVFLNDPFPDENEFSLLGGFFPHRIFGIYHDDLKVLLINNYLLSQFSMNLIKSDCSDEIIDEGINIPQDNFVNSKTFKQSMYKGALAYSKKNGFNDKFIK